MNAYGFTGGRFSFRFEDTVHRFQNLVADAVVGLELCLRKVAESLLKDLWNNVLESGLVPRGSSLGRVLDCDGIIA